MIAYNGRRVGTKEPLKVGKLIPKVGTWRRCYVKKVGTRWEPTKKRYSMRK